MRHTLRLLGEDTARVIVVDSTTSQAQPDDGVLPASRLGRTGAYESAGRRGTGCDSRRAGERSSGGTEHCENREGPPRRWLRGFGEVEREKLDVDFGLRIVLGQPVTFHRLIIISSLRTLTRTLSLSVRSDLIFPLNGVGP